MKNRNTLIARESDILEIEKKYKNGFEKLFVEYERKEITLSKFFLKSISLAHKICEESDIFYYCGIVDPDAYGYLKSIGWEKVVDIYEKEREHLSLNEIKKFEAVKFVKGFEGDIIG